MYNSSDSLAPLLEFMDGFGSNSDISCVVLGTTNHLDKLDKAIGERPCRFNRKIFFDYLAIQQIEFILKNLFQQDIKEEFLDIFRNKEKITPSHLAEIYRTAKMMQIKNKSVDPIDFFLKATEEVLNSFTPTINTKPVGFRDIGED
jgi:ATP-dependent 26S proteasome regulatory subunit